MTFVSGPAIHCYNLSTLISVTQTRHDPLVNAGIRQQFECEVFSWGYLPLAYSVRCFTSSL